MQLDIFDDSRDVMLRNDVAAALERRDAAAARAAWQALEHEYPHDAALAALRTLTDAIDAEAAAPAAAWADHAAAHAARAQLAGPIEAAAVQVYGPAAAAWLRPLWRALARRAAALPFQARHADDHAAPLWLRAGDAAEAAAAVERIESWRRIPAPLGWMAEARHRACGLQAAWPLLAELAWLAPARLETLMPRLADPVLDQLRARFDATFEPLPESRAMWRAEPATPDLAWFPAWVLVEKPALADVLGSAQPSRHTPPEQALRLVVELLGLEHQGRHHDLVQRRRQLRDLQPGLYQAYMATR
jgi:hypothetical protein